MFKFYLRVIIPCVAAVLCVLATGWLFWHCAFYKAGLAALGSVLVCGTCDAVIKDARAEITDDAENPAEKKPWSSRYHSTSRTPTAGAGRLLRGSLNH